MVEIYALIDPVTNEIKYIGKANDSQNRLKSHLRDSKTRDTPVYLWIRELIKQGLIPLIEILSIVENDQWVQEEIRLISEYKGICSLLNVAVGGNEPYFSKEQRAINGRNNASEIHSDPIRKKLWSLKKDLMSSLSIFMKRGEIRAYNRILSKMKSRLDVFPNAATISFITDVEVWP